MIKEEFVTIKWARATLTHYKSLGYTYTKLGDEFNVLVEHLPNGSAIKITSVCDSCGMEKIIRRSSYAEKCFSCLHDYKKADKKNINFNLIQEKFITTKWNVSNKDRYINLGYILTKINDQLIVKIEHLPKQSNTKITIACKKCSILRVIPFSAYKEYCAKCSAQNYQENLKKAGKDHHNKNLELSDRDREIHRGLDSRKWSICIKERDNYTCQICSIRGGVLVSHHLMSYHKYKDLRYDINNGICLCTECHKNFHSSYGQKNNTKEQFDEYKFYKQLNKLVDSVRMIHA